jgi:hypothetical protein
MDAQHAGNWREVTAKLQEAVACSARSPAASAGDTADAVQALVLDEGHAVESDVVKDAAMVTATLQRAADAELFVVDRQGDVVTLLNSYAVVVHIICGVQLVLQASSCSWLRCLVTTSSL